MRKPSARRILLQSVKDHSINLFSRSKSELIHSLTQTLICGSLNDPLNNLPSLKKQTFAKLRKQEAKVGSAVSLTSFDIASWAAQSTAATMAENDHVFEKDDPWTKERVLEDWDVSLEYARNKLLIEKVKGRIAFLEEILSIVKSVGMCKCSYRFNKH